MDPKDNSSHESRREGYISSNIWDGRRGRTSQLAVPEFPMKAADGSRNVE